MNPSNATPSYLKDLPDGDAYYNWYINEFFTPPSKDSFSKLSDSVINLAKLAIFSYYQNSKILTQHSECITNLYQRIKRRTQVALDLDKDIKSKSALMNHLESVLASLQRDYEHLSQTVDYNTRVHHDQNENIQTILSVIEKQEAGLASLRQEQEHLRRLEPMITEIQERVDFLNAHLDELHRENQELRTALTSRVHQLEARALAEAQEQQTQSDVLAGQFIKCGKDILFRALEGFKTRNTDIETPKQDSQTLDALQDLMRSLTPHHQGLKNAVERLAGAMDLAPDIKPPAFSRQQFERDQLDLDKRDAYLALDYLQALKQVYRAELDAYENQMHGDAGEQFFHQWAANYKEALDDLVAQLLDLYRPKPEAPTPPMPRPPLDRFLATVDLAILPIEVGKTPVDATRHDICRSRQGDFVDYVVAEVYNHGLWRPSNHEIVRRALVVRGEPAGGT